MQCKLVDKKTGEPKVFYKTDQGEVFDNMREAINNSSRFYTTGVYKNSEEFVDVVTTPKFDPDSIQGKIQGWLGDGTIISKAVNNKQMFEVVGTSPMGVRENMMNIKQELDVAIGRNEYTIRGNNLVLGTKIQLPTNLNRPSEIIEEYGEGIGANLLIHEAFKEKEEQDRKPQPTQFTKQELKDKMLGILDKMGFSTTSIQDYMDRYEARHKVTPTAEALIDTVEKVVAFKNGEIMLSELTEEVSHLIIEGWDRAEVDRLLDKVPDLAIFDKYYHQYRDIYERQNPSMSEEAIEKLVRKEILGKYLSQQLQDPKQPQDYVEESIINKMFTLLRDFFNSIFVNESIQSEIDSFVADVQAHIYNDTLAEQLDMDNSDGVVMFSAVVEKDQLVSIINKVRTKLNKITSSKESIPEDLALMDAQMIYLAAAETVSVMNREASAMRRLLHNRKNLDVTLSATEQAKIQVLITELDGLLPGIVSATEGLKGISTTDKKKLNTVAMETISDMFEIKKMYEAENTHDREKIEEKLAKVFGWDKDHPRRDWLGEQVDKVQKEHSALFNFFAPLMLSNNVFVKAIGRLTSTMYQQVAIAMDGHFNKYIGKFDKINVEGLLDGNFIVSDINRDAYDRERRGIEYDIKAKIDDTLLYDEKGDLITRDEYVNSQKLATATMSASHKAVFNFLMFYERVNNQEVFGKLNEFEERLLDQYRVLGLTPNTYDKISGGIEFLMDHDRMNQARRDIENKYDKGDPLYAEEMNSLKSRERALTNPLEDRPISMVYFNTEEEMLTYLAKDGLKISTQPTRDSVLWKNPSTGNALYVRVLNKRNLEASKLFLHLKAKEYNRQQFEALGRGDVAELSKNFVDAYRKYRERLEKNPNLTPTQIEDMSRNWVFANGNFGYTDDFFAQMDATEYNIEDLPDAVRPTAEKIKNTLDALAKYRRQIMSEASHFRSYNETDPSLFSEETKENLDIVEEEQSRLRSELMELFASNGVEVVRTDSIIQNRPNNAFRKAFEVETGQKYENASIKVKEDFLFSHTEIPRKSMARYEKFKEAFTRDRLTKGQQEYIANIMEERGLLGSLTDKETVLSVLIEDSIPSYYKRFEPKGTSMSYASYINKIMDGTLSIDRLMSDISSNSFPPYVQFNVGSRFNFYDANEVSMEELVDNFVAEQDQTRKLEILKEISAHTKVGEKFENKDFEATIRGREEAYLSAMEMALIARKTYKVLNSGDVFEKFHFRKTGIKRTADLLKGGRQLSEVKSEIWENISYRPDEFEDAYKEGLSVNAIPKIGLYRLPVADGSTDFVEMLFRGLHEANMYEQRVNNFKETNSILETMRSRMDDGSKTTKAVEEYISQHYFGRKSIQHMRVDVMGKEVDFSKVMLGMRNFFSMMGIGTSPVVALTAYTTAKFQEYLMYIGGRDLYQPAHNRASWEYKKLIGGSIKDLGSLTGDSKAEVLMRYLGIHDPSQRYMNAEYNGLIRNLPMSKVMYGPMSATMLPVSMKIGLSVMMEYRFINGKLYDFATFEEYMKVVEQSDMTTEELREEFEKYKDESLYDRFDPDTEGYGLDISDADRRKVMSKIEEFKRRIQAESPAAGKVLAQSHPLLGYMFTYRNWLSTAAIWSFDGLTRKLDQNKGGVRFERYYNDMTNRDDIGRVTAMYEYALNVKDLYKSKGFEALREAWNATDGAGRQALRESIAAQGIIAGLILATSIILRYADDDEEEDNYPLQLLAYIAARTVNESFSAAGPAGLGVVNETLAAIQNPIVISNNLYNMVGLTDVTKMGETVKSGPYKGWNKYVADMFKIVSLRNMYTASTADNVKHSRESYMFFNVKDSSFSALPLVVMMQDSGEDEE